MSASNPSFPDPQTGLTQADVDLVRSTWLLLEETSRPLGVLILLQFFDSSPSYKTKFSRFKDCSNEELMNDKRFEAHACYIVHMLGAVVHSLNDFPTLAQLCKDLGEQHGMMGIPKEAFWDLKLAIMNVVGVTFSDKMPPGAGAAWSLALDVIINEVTGHLQMK
jgi:hypothetical protein